jgi:hypothetical protein
MNKRVKIDKNIFDQSTDPAERLLSGPSPLLPAKGVKKERLKETSFYITSEQVQKLDDVADDLKKRLKDRNINRQTIIRALIDMCDTNAVESNLRVKVLNGDRV